MGTTQIREDLHEFIDHGDNSLKNTLHHSQRVQPGRLHLQEAPISEETLRDRVRAAKNKVKAGQYISQDELEKEMKTW